MVSPAILKLGQLMARLECDGDLRAATEFECECAGTSPQDMALARMFAKLSAGQSFEVVTDQEGLARYVEVANAAGASLDSAYPLTTLAGAILEATDLPLCRGVFVPASRG